MLRDALGLGQNLANKLDHGLPMVCVHRTAISLNTFSINIHHNQPKKTSLKFSIQGNLDRFLKNAFSKWPNRAEKQNISFSWSFF